MDILSQADCDVLDDLVITLEMSEGTQIIYAIAPESGPKHPVIDALKSVLDLDEFRIDNFFYSDNSLINFLYGLDRVQPSKPDLLRGESERDQFSFEWVEIEENRRRRVVMAFGIEQLSTPRMARELKQLNLGRDELFRRGLVLIFWLNKRNFIEEFRRRAPDFWDWRGKVVQFQSRPRLEPLLYPYLESLIAENSSVKISGVMQVQRQVDIFLDQIYVSLQAEYQKQVTETLGKDERVGGRKLDFVLKTPQVVEVDGEKSRALHYEFEPVISDFMPTSISTKTVTEKVDLASAVRDKQYSVILGDPGAGKTTLLRYLALHFAQARRDEKEKVLAGEIQEDLGKTLLPVFFRIADYAERLVKEPDLSLLDFLNDFYQQWEIDLKNHSEGEIDTGIAQLLCEKMRYGVCLILMDGLDEVFNQESRQKIVQRIEDFVADYPDNKYVITSRIAGYQEVKLGETFAHLTIAQMESEEVERFLHRWCLAIEKTQKPEANEEIWLREAEKEAGELLEAIRDNEGVERLTGNPLLLTILALIHRNGSRLPNRRVELYALAAKTLIEDWQLSKNLPNASKVVLKESEVIELLAPLAYWMHEEKPSGLITQGEAEEKLGEKLAELNDEDPESDNVKEAVKEFLRRVRETTGLFVERATGVYGFMHLTFEEYFAARYIEDNEVSDILDIIQEHLYDARWNEPILLALGYLGIHNPKRVNNLVERLFKGLDEYQPVMEKGEITVKNTSSNQPILVWSILGENGEILQRESASILQELLFAGQVVAEVEVNSRIRAKVIEKLGLTYVGLDRDFEEDITNKLLKLLRKIEIFNQKGEVISYLRQVIQDDRDIAEQWVKAQSAMLYVACGESGRILVDCVTEIVNQLEPNLFCSIRDLMTELGGEMTPALEMTRQNQSGVQIELDFVTAMSYIRKDNYNKAIAILEKITERLGSNISPYIDWSLASCYQGEKKFDRAIGFYQACFEKLEASIKATALLIFWRNWGVCYRLHGKYEEAVDGFERMLAIAKEVRKGKDESLALYHIGRTYQEWGKYETAISYHQQSRQLYQELEKQENVANQWYNLANCYREWGKYRQGIECAEKDLAIRQQLEDKPRIALAYYQLGRIYQSWQKYETAISYHQQSRQLYEELSKEEDVADLWYNLAVCYREWEKYHQGIECAEKDLAIRQQLEDKPNIADAYFQLGRIYQSWQKYETAISYYQQSRQLYQELEKQDDVANLWCFLAVCYREWGKYHQGIECAEKDLAIRQQLEDKPNIADAYFQLGRIYQDWQKYETAISYYQQSRQLYQELEQHKDVANSWYFLAVCYREWGKYHQAIECAEKDLAIRQQLEDKPSIALAYFQLGRIYQSWEKYETAISYYQQSRQLYQELEQHKDVANSWYFLAVCYREWGKYHQAIECAEKDLAIRQQLEDKPNIADAYYQLGRIYQDWKNYEQALEYQQQSHNLYLELGQNEDIARSYRRLAYRQRLLAKNTTDTTKSLNLLTQAEKNIHQAIQINTAGEYKNNLAYDYTQLSLIYSEYLHFLPKNDPSLPAQISQFENYYQTGLTYFTQLNQTLNRAEETIDISRAYLEVEPLENLNKAEALAKESLEIFQQYNRHQLQAAAYKLLGEIYLKRTQQNQPNAKVTAHQFLSQSLEIYQEINLTEKATEVEQLKSDL